MIIKLHGHIGTAASALVDGQLSAEDEERAWAHVLVCAGCRRLVEREGWTKQRLAGLAQPPVSAPVPRHLVDALGSLSSPDAAAHWAHVRRLERRSVRRRTAVALAGAGSLGVAAAAMLALTGPLAEESPTPVERGPATIRPDVVESAVGGALPPGVLGTSPTAPASSSPAAAPSAAPAPEPLAGRVAR